MQRVGSDVESLLREFGPSCRSFVSVLRVESLEVEVEEEEEEGEGEGKGKGKRRKRRKRKGRGRERGRGRGGRGGRGRAVVFGEHCHLDSFRLAADNVPSFKTSFGITAPCVPSKNR